MPTTSAPPSLDRVPKAIADLLKRGDRAHKHLTPAQQESAAAGLATCGIQGGPNLEWMAKLIRHRLGVGDYPTPPIALASDAWGYQLAQERAEVIAQAVKAAT